MNVEAKRASKPARLCEHPNGRCDAPATTTCVSCGTPLCAAHAYYGRHGALCANCPDDNTDDGFED